MTQEFLQQIQNIVNALGYDCLHVSFITDSSRLRLQILIDTQGGINTHDCEIVASRVNEFLDSSPDIPALSKGRYYLEVSSPGIERPLYTFEDYVRFQGKEARLRLSAPVEGRKTFTGVIQQALDGNVIILCEDGEKSIPFTSIKGGNLVFRFGNEDRKKNRKGKN